MFVACKHAPPKLNFKRVSLLFFSSSTISITWQVFFSRNVLFNHFGDICVLLTDRQVFAWGNFEGIQQRVPRANSPYFIIILQRNTKRKFHDFLTLLTWSTEKLLTRAGFEIFEIATTLTVSVRIRGVSILFQIHPGRNMKRKFLWSLTLVSSTEETVDSSGVSTRTFGNTPLSTSSAIESLGDKCAMFLFSLVSQLDSVGNFKPRGKNILGRSISPADSHLDN